MKKIIVSLLMVLSFAMQADIAVGAKPRIKDGSKVKFYYVLKINGREVDSNKGKKPFDYIHGQNMVVKGLEEGLKGLKAGDKKVIVVPPEKGYGKRNEKAVIVVPRSDLNLGAEPQKGMIIRMRTPQGVPLSGMIIAVRDKTLVVDFNHPLAGAELHFEVEIVEVQ